MSPFLSTADVCHPTGGSSFMGEMCIDVYNTSNKHFSIPNSAYLTPLATQCPGFGGYSNLGVVNWARWAGQL
jgi:hypothetical protein